MPDTDFKTAITLPSCLTPLCGSICGECGSILVTDSFSPSVFVFSPCGTLINKIETMTPFRYVSSAPGNSCILVLKQGCQNKITCLNSMYNEQFCVTPTLDEGVIKSVFPLPNGNFLVCFRNLLAIVSRLGNLICILRENNDPLIEFNSAVYTADSIALLYTKGSVQLLEINSESASSVFAFPNSYRLRNLTLSAEGTLYVFGVQGYGNAFLSPVYSNGNFIFRG